MLFFRKLVPKYDNTVLQRNFRQITPFLSHFSQNVACETANGVVEFDSPRFNPVNIQMLSNSLKRQIFGDVVPKYDTQNVSRMVEHLKRHELWNKETSELAKQMHLKLPKLYGENLDEHFREIAVRQSCEYRENAQIIAQCFIPKTPKKWVFQPGWVKYNEDGNAESVDFPDELALVFDVEVCVKEGPTPILATAVSKDYWYSWCSDSLIEDHFNHGQKITTQNLINLETKFDENNPPQCEEWKKRLIIGHNVSYDRARIKEQYYIQGSKMRFLDTMSLHIAIAGLTGLQRALVMAEKTGSKRKPVNAANNNHHRGPPVKDWMKVGSVNNLAEVYKLHCKKKLNKEPRNIFVTGKISDVRASFQDLMTYCAEDVKATHSVLKVLLPQFFQRFPHPVTFAGMLELSVAYLPVNHNWERYLRESQATYDDLEQELKMMLMHLANEACELLHNEEYKKDPWLWDLDWSVKEIRSKKVPPPSTRKRKGKIADENIVKELTESEEKEQLVKKVLDTVKHLYVRRPHMAGYPTWFRSLCPRPCEHSDEYGSGPSLISTQMQVTPKLLRLTWEGYPMHYSEVHGWGYLVPETNKLTDLPAGDTKFPFQSVLKLCTSKVNESEVDEKQVDMDELWQQLAEGVMDQREEALFWNLIKGDHENGKKDGKSSTNPKSLGPFWESDTPGCLFYKLPHKNGPENRVGNPLAKDFLAKIEDGAIRASSGAKADRALKLSKMMSYWRNANERIKSQMVVCLNKGELDDSSVKNEFMDVQEGFYGAILPQIVTAGTVTRRAVEATWLTASNAYEDRVGSELKAMIQAFPGYHFVGADVDSQELWIAAILGDSTYGGVHGCTAFGWMTLQGKKSNGTDMHSKTAAAVGISRDQAKVLNYGRIYGAGQTFTSRLLMQYNHKLTVDEAKAKSHLIYSTTKGVRGYLLNQTGKKIWQQYYYNNKNKDHLKDKLDSAEVLGISSNGEEIILSRSQMLNLLKLSGRKFELWDLVEKPIWIGGTESPMFNKLEEIALSPEPKTPVLNGRITMALEPRVVLYNFMTSRVNWVVQSSAVDYLHLMLVSMRWLLEEYNMKGRFSISIHDEVRYLVKSEDRYRVALALQVTNLLTRALFALKLDMMDLPHCVAFFSSVDIDTVIRKEVNLDCKTPSNPHGLQNGYKIPPGNAVDINQVLKITNGLLAEPGNERTSDYVG